jgi:hypothetical protein
MPNMQNLQEGVYPKIKEECCCPVTYKSGTFLKYGVLHAVVKESTL